MTKGSNPASPKATKADAARVLAARRAQRQRDAWKDDPTLFAREALGVELWDAQIEVANDVRDHTRVSWRSGQKTGKSTIFAVLALWWVYTRPRALVVLSSGNASQVRIVLWREVTRLYREAERKGIALGEYHRDPATGLTFDDGRAVVGITAADAERFAGYSGDELMILIDEASGFDDEIIEAALGNLAGGGRVLLAGNPTKTVGFFARTHRESLAGWKLHHTSSLDTPNVKQGKVVVPGLALLSWAKQMADDFGIDSAAYAVRVLGQYAAQQSDAVIPLALLSTATDNWVDGYCAVTANPLEIGVDPARFGDDESVIQGRIGKHALRPSFHQKLDNVEVAARVVEYVHNHRDPGQRVVIRIDTGGLGGGVYDHLLRALGGDSLIIVESVNAASSSRFPSKFRSTRDQLWFGIRRALERGLTLPPDQKRDQELLAARYSHDAKLRVVVESKDEMRKRIKRSPDRADALALACFGEHPLADGEAITSSLVERPAHAGQPHPVHGERVRSPWGGRSASPHAGARNDLVERQRQLGAGPGGWRGNK